MVFIVAGMGGGTGTGSAPIVAEAAKEMGILTVGVVTKPFWFEGRRRMQQAEAGIVELQSKVDSLVVIPNDRIKHVTDQKITFANGFQISDDVLRQALISVSEIITKPSLINVDFADMCTVMKDAGLAHMGGPHGYFQPHAGNLHHRGKRRASLRCRSFGYGTGGGGGCRVHGAGGHQPRRKHHPGHNP